MKPIRSGRYRKRLQIQIPPGAPGASTTANAANELDLVGGWVTIATVWGSITPLSGNERFFAEQVQADSIYKIEIRYFPGLSDSYRFAYVEPQTKKLRTFNIVNVNDTHERHYEHVCMCHEAGP